MKQDCRSEIMAVRDFLQSHQHVSEMTIKSEEQATEVNLLASNGEDPEWQVMQDIISDYFFRKYQHTIDFDFGDKWELDVKSTKNLEDGQTEKDISNKILIYATDKNDWRLFRYTSSSGISYDKNYFLPSQQIADMETSNLDKIFSTATKDMAEKRFVRNIVELNINCLNEKELQKQYTTAFQQLPKQLRNRIAISLVRIDKSISMYELKQAMTVCKLCTDNILLSFSYEAILSKDKVEHLTGINGIVLTVNTEKFSTVNDIHKVHETATKLFKGKNIFIIFEGGRGSEKMFFSKNVRIFEKAKQIDLPI
ncbi:MAG: hypothetical protein AAF228_05185 [Pseudomonadota bacterium]